MGGRLKQAQWNGGLFDVFVKREGGWEIRGKSSAEKHHTYFSKVIHWSEKSPALL